VLKELSNVTKSGLTEWKEVICEKDIDQEFLSNLALSLRAKGYSVNEPIIVTKRAVLKELTEYQKLNDLPIGSFNFESLETLDIYVDVSKNK